MSAEDSQLVELAGRNWLASQLQRGGIEVARPERDRGVDLIGYIDKGLQEFIARPIQMKAATGALFSLDQKYANFPGLLLVYIWRLGDPSKTTCYALTYFEAFRIAEEMGWTATNSWREGSYSTTQPSKRLCVMLAQFEMTPEKWQQKITAK